MSDKDATTQRKFSLSPARLQNRLVAVVLFLSLAGVLSEMSRYVFFDERYPIAAAFSLSYEANVPTWYSSIQLMCCSVLLAAVAVVERKRGVPVTVPYWWGLSLGFLYISLDEVVTIHEKLAGLVKAGGGILYFDWIIPAGALVLVLGLLYLRFLKHLESRPRRQFVLAGSIYVGGALGLELALGYWTDNFGKYNIGYGIIDAVEETMEMLGIALFLCALVEYLQARVAVTVSPPRSGDGNR